MADVELFPFLAVRDVDAAVAFYCEAFGAVEEGERIAIPDGRQAAVLRIGDRRLGVATEDGNTQTRSPESLGATTVRVSLHVDDPDAVQARAIEAGATEMFPVTDQPYGLRQGRVVDPSGHHWLIARDL